MRTVARAIALLLCLACLVGVFVVGFGARQQMQDNDALAKTSMQGTLAEIIGKSPRHNLVEATLARLDLIKAEWGGDFGLPGSDVVVPAWPADGKRPKQPPVLVVSQRPEWLETVRSLRALKRRPKAMKEFLRVHKADLMPTVHLSGLIRARTDFDTPDQWVLARVAAASAQPLVLLDGFLPDVDGASRQAIQAIALGVEALLLATLAWMKPKAEIKLPSPEEVSLRPLSVTDADNIKLTWRVWQGSRFLVEGTLPESVALNRDGTPVFRNATTTEVIMGAPATIFRRSRPLLMELYATEEFQTLSPDQRNLILSAVVQCGLSDAAIELLALTRKEVFVTRCVALWKDCILEEESPESSPCLLLAGLDMDATTRAGWTSSIVQAKLALDERQEARLHRFITSSMEVFRMSLQAGYNTLGVPTNIDN